MADTMKCPHRTWLPTPPEAPTHYACRECGEVLALGEPVTEPVETWKDKEDACRK